MRRPCSLPPRAGRTSLPTLRLPRVPSPQLTHFTDTTLEEPFRLIEAKVHEVGAYVGRWLQFQSLWDLEPEQVFHRLGDSLSLWAQLLTEIKQTRSTFDNADSQRSFGVCVIDYATVQSKVNAKYDTWQREILARYGTKLAAAMRDTHAAVLKARHDLEHHSIEGSSTTQAVTFITFVQDLKKHVVRWTPEIADFTTGQQTLERQRYQFPPDWLYVDQVQGEWSAFNEILKRKNDSIQQQLSGLQMKIVAEDRILDGRIDEALAEWEASKPIQGQVKAEAAMNTITIFEARLTKLQEDYELVCRAKDVRRLPPSSSRVEAIRPADLTRALPPFVLDPPPCRLSIWTRRGTTSCRPSSRSSGTSRPSGRPCRASGRRSPRSATRAGRASRYVARLGSPLPARENDEHPPPLFVRSPASSGSSSTACSRRPRRCRAACASTARSSTSRRRSGRC